MSEKKPLQRILVLVSACAFLGSTGYGLFGMFSSAFQQPTDATTTEAASVDQQLAAQEQGYELVLEREPENQTALEGLVETRLEMKDTKGAIAPLEKLVELNPQQEEYKARLVELKQQVGKVSEGEEESDR
ncbi:MULTISPECIES: tetratricopeptide repeat protein [unclassified Coleofasciculus]|uniref:tetratricopeptide repeat protein n=1 Tax=unclassified Coleofasciculus TaxID=2692782 RepID=UPI00188007A5|nr:MULTISPECIES: tetratricopeptide repeat protein [unclassified Coleofasciculus]MBE9125459.1 tetratricopeptide repeat protein [Coleofasciculus sp. LEGE 07081]MBE9147145.1 tetratricopeptide repeat protein [Coleofasciculus sp. LEGE 07092]